MSIKRRTLGSLEWNLLQIHQVGLNYPASFVTSSLDFVDEERIGGRTEVSHPCCYDSSPIYTYFLTFLTYDAPPESPYSSGPPTGPLEPIDRLMPNPYPN